LVVQKTHFGTHDEITFAIHEIVPSPKLLAKKSNGEIWIIWLGLVVVLKKCFIFVLMSDNFDHIYNQ